MKYIVLYLLGGSNVELLFLNFLTSPIVVWLLCTPPISWLLNFFCPQTERNDPLPSGPVTLIYLITYGASPEGLTKMSYGTTVLAARIAEQYPLAKILSCTFKGNKEGSNEWANKLSILPQNRAFNSGEATSTTDERELIMDHAVRLGIDLERFPIIVLGDGGHIRRASMIIEYFHPRSKFCFRCTPAQRKKDPLNPMKAQRQWQTWVIANRVGIVFYKLLGIEYFAKKNLSQPTN